MQNLIIAFHLRTALRRIATLCRLAPVARRGNPQDRADRLDPEGVAMPITCPDCCDAKHSCSPRASPIFRDKKRYVPDKACGWRASVSSIGARRTAGPVGDRTATPFSTVSVSAKQKSSAEGGGRVLHCGAFASEREKPPNKEDRTTVAAGDPY
ncbi:hypothetical protein KDW36_09195 [Burkholderia dolosa]|nr:hypothetical protein [Burkholderia dolosa]